MMQQMNERMMNVMDEMIREAVEHCGRTHGFDAKTTLDQMYESGILMGSCKTKKEKVVKEKVIKEKKSKKVVTETTQVEVAELDVNNVNNAEENVDVNNVNNVEPVVVKEKVVKEKAVKVVKEKVIKEDRMILPYSGEIIAKYCQTIKRNYGLFSQCNNDKVDGKNVCKSCDKYIEKNGKPECGWIQDRTEDYKDEKGQAPIAYKRVMTKLKLTEEMVLAEVAKQEVPFNPEHLKEKESQRGRPKKEKEAKEDADKKRGRPKKEEKKVEVDSTEDLFATLMKEAQDAKELEAEESEEEEEEPEVEVKKFEHEGKKYLKSSDNTIYDMDSQDEIGRWNEETSSIELF